MKTLRAVEKKPSRAQVTARTHWKHYYVKSRVKVTPEGNKIVVPRTIVRGSYFIKLRTERRVLNILRSQLPRKGIENRKFLHRVYYRTLPFLYHKLEHPRDRFALREIESIYYNLLCLADYRRGSFNGVCRLNYMIRNYTTTERISLSLEARKSGLPD